MTEANFYTTKERKVAACGLCHHRCLIAPGKTGICAARKNQGGKLYSLVYGFPAALNIDPIEKKPLFHFLPGTSTFSLGTYGCNFQCANCQNYDISQIKNIEKKLISQFSIPPEKIVEDAIGDECPSLSFTYNEPTVYTEYAMDIMKIGQQTGLKNIWVSNGYFSQDCLSALLPYLDAVNIDLKSLDDDFYRDNCGARLQPVLDNLITLKKAQIHVEITTLIIPGLTDDIEMLSRLAGFIVTELDDDTPWHISKFSPEISWKLKQLPPTGDDFIYQAYEIGKGAGLKYVYVGNIPGDQKENTYCPKCGELGILRLGYHIERHDQSGRCSACDRSLDIIE
jgi:pyruvate formate lyase activating enzyme